MLRRSSREEAVESSPSPEAIALPPILPEGGNLMLVSTVRMIGFIKYCRRHMTPENGVSFPRNVQVRYNREGQSLQSSDESQALSVSSCSSYTGSSISNRGDASSVLSGASSYMQGLTDINSSEGSWGGGSGSGSNNEGGSSSSSSGAGSIGSPISDQSADNVPGRVHQPVIIGAPPAPPDEDGFDDPQADQSAPLLQPPRRVYYLGTNACDLRLASLVMQHVNLIPGCTLQSVQITHYV